MNLIIPPSKFMPETINTTSGRRILLQEKYALYEKTTQNTGRCVYDGHDRKTGMAMLKIGKKNQR